MSASRRTPTQVQTREEALNWIAHEIKNPLGVAMMNAELLIRHSHDDYERRHLAMLKRHLERLDELVVSVLDAARLEDGRVLLRTERADLGSFVEPVIDEWRAAHPTWTFDLDPGRGPVPVAIDASGSARCSITSCPTR
jgi:two-component system, sensor histidine kinase and response regulator